MQKSIKVKKLQLQWKLHSFSLNLETHTNSAAVWWPQIFNEVKESVLYVFGQTVFKGCDGKNKCVRATNAVTLKETELSNIFFTELWQIITPFFLNRFHYWGLLCTTRCKAQCCLLFILPLLTFATPTKGEWSGWVGLWTLLYVQIPHVLFVRGPWFQGLEKALVTWWVLPCELQATFHALNTCKKLQKKRTWIKNLHAYQVKTP